MKLKNFPHNGLDFKELAPKFKGLSRTDIERVCFDSIKTAILCDKDSIEQEILENAPTRQRKRLSIAEIASGRKSPKELRNLGGLILCLLCHI